MKPSENLPGSLERFYLPMASPAKAKSPFNELISKLSWTAFRNNTPFYLFIFAFFAVNIGLFVSRAIEFKDQNGFYILARAAGITSLYSIFLFIL